MSNIAFLTMDNLEGFVSYDHLAVPALNDLNHEIQFVSWRQPADWSQFDMVIIRTTWDYQNDLDAFLGVLQKINNSEAILENSMDLVKWNIEKNYLRELDQKGNPIVPTIWETGSFNVHNVSNYFDAFDTDHFIIKPTVSANADNTFWIKKNAFGKELEILQNIFSQRSFMVQPFMESVVDEGEYSLFYFNGKYSHCILKTPKEHDFRVQEEHGGVIRTAQPNDTMLRQGEKAIQALPDLPLYARVDFVRDDENQFLIMEMELIEPSLYFSYDLSSPKRFAQAVDERLQNNY
jgi:hypothetical protein